MGWALAVAWLRLLPGSGGLLAAAPPPQPSQTTAGWLADPALSRLALRTLVRAPDGLLWVGADDGVYRYDGTTLVPLNALRRHGPPLPPASCHHLLFTPDGTLWLGTEAGAFRFTTAGVLVALPYPQAGTTSHLIDGLALTPDRRHVWVAQDRAGLRAYTLAGQPVGPLLTATAPRLDVWPAPDGTLWLSEARGRTRHLTADGQLLGEWHHPNRFMLPVADPTRRVWLLSERAAYRTGPDGRLLPGPHWAPPGPESNCDLIRTDTSVALLTQQRVWQLRWTAAPDPQPRLRFSLGLPAWRTAGWSARLRTDAAGNWWLFDTGVRGAWRRTGAAAFIQPLALANGKPYSVRATTRLPDGRLLVSAYEVGLLVQAADSPLAPLRPWPTARLPDGQPPLLLSIVPARVGAARRGWLAGTGGPFVTLDPVTGRVQPILATELTAETRDDANVRALCRDGATGLIWGGARTGLYCFDSTSTTFRPYRPPGQSATLPAPLVGQTIEDLWADGRGHLWLAMPQGVDRLTLATGERRHYGPTAPAPHRVAGDGARCLYADPATNRLWVGTRAHGLVLITPDGNAHTALSVGQGLPNASVATITPGPGGALWLGTYQGLVRYVPATGRLAVFTLADGLLSDEFNARAAYFDPTDSSLLLGGVAGLHRIYPRQVPNLARGRARLVLTALTALGVSADSSQTYYRLAADPLPSLHLGPNHPVVDLHLALTDFQSGAQARYFYRVRGWLSDRWLPLGTTPLLRLQGLLPGTYTVEIRAETSQGILATNHLRLPLTVTAEWWRRPTTWTAAALALVALVVAWQRERERRARRDTAMRSRLAADLHDEVGSLLTRVMMQAEMLNVLGTAPPARLAALVDDSRAAANTVRDIIWSVDAAADTLTALVDRLHDLCDASSRATDREIRFDASELPPNRARPLPPAVRQHVYLIAREAVTNALRHSAPTVPLTLTLRYHSALLELRVRNEGPMEEAAAAKPSARAGQGLRNMRQRAELLNATLALGPHPEGGWEVALRVPL